MGVSSSEAGKGVLPLTFLMPASLVRLTNTDNRIKIGCPVIGHLARKLRAEQRKREARERGELRWSSERERTTENPRKGVVLEFVEESEPERKTGKFVGGKDAVETDASMRSKGEVRNFRQAPPFKVCMSICCKAPQMRR
jgi:hypothetical protein